nr:unnamed protein product [Digitaria exilis]
MLATSYWTAAERSDWRRAEEQGSAAAARAIHGGAGRCRQGSLDSTSAVLDLKSSVLDSRASMLDPRMVVLDLGAR